LNLFSKVYWAWLLFFRAPTFLTRYWGGHPPPPPLIHFLSCHDGEGGNRCQNKGCPSPTWWQLRSISPTFYVQLLHTQFPKAQKKTDGLKIIFALLGSARIKAASKMLVKLILWIQQNYTQLYQWTHVEVAPKYYALLSTLSARKISVNLLTKKLLIECWWNWHLESSSPILYVQLFRVKVLFAAFL